VVWDVCDGEENVRVGLRWVVNKINVIEKILGGNGIVRGSTPCRGGLGACPPRKILNFRTCEIATH